MSENPNLPQAPAVKVDPLVIAWLRRPEVVTLIVAAIVTLIGALGLPAKSGLPIPEAEITAIIGGAWAVALGFVFEGRFSGEAAGNVFARLARSLKFQFFAGQILASVLVALGRVVGIEVPEDAVVTVLNMLIAGILGKPVIDSVAAVVRRGA